LGVGTGGGIVVARSDWGPVGRGSGALPLGETQGEEAPCTVIHIGARHDWRRGRQFDGDERAATTGAPELEIEELATILMHVAARGTRGPETRIWSSAHREVRVPPHGRA
jgi:hypothetical protein